ncbi:MAG: DUF2268 domain-containing putative Zn-dependent protease [Bacteroidetes bacterium]|nr:DUF2268 domain-containing putative Zn-dependent protease [Bacteroidota bacterium]
MRAIWFVFCFWVSVNAMGQTKVYTDDIRHFYEAFDSVNLQTDKTLQLKTVQTLYVDRASQGLKDFMALGGGNTQRWLNYMLYNKKYLQGIRPNLESISGQIPEIQSRLAQVKEVYPGFKDGSIYFIVGCGLVGGSPSKSTQSLILGAEVLVKKNAQWAIPSAIHEFIHLQQKDGNGQLLTQTLNEGVAEFLSEVFFEQELAGNGYAPHIVFGKNHEAEVWKQFKADMFVKNRGFMGWLYGSKAIGGKEVQDLGYFLGYKICKAFYEKTTDKTAAISTLLELDVSSDESIRAFVVHSGYGSPADREYIAKGIFTEEKEESQILKKVYGYRIKGQQVIFEFSPPQVFLDRFKGDIGKVSVAGSFNDWNPGAEPFSLKRVAENRFELVLPKERLKLDSRPQFKFVINEDIWMPAPETALNVDDSSGNLVMEQ